MDLHTFYQDRILAISAERRKLDSRSTRVAFARFAVFALIVLLTVYFMRERMTAGLFAPLALLILFLWLVQLAARLDRRIRHLDLLIRINEEEAGALKGDYSHFDPGNEFIDYQHEYSYDLDIFGTQGIYRMTCRAATPAGRQSLADALSNPVTDPLAIRELQEAVREMAGKPHWRQDFLAAARASEWKEERKRMADNWVNSKDYFTATGLYRGLILANALIALVLPFLVAYSVLPAIFLLYYLLPAGLVLLKTRIINREQQKVERLLEEFRKYAQLLDMIEKEQFTSRYIKEQQHNLLVRNVPASRIMKQLTGILWGLEARGNLIMAVILNLFFLWDILLIIRLENWRRKFKDAFSRWIGVVAAFERINSLAATAFNHPEYRWPEVLDGPFRLELEDAGHPLIDPGKRVDNSLSFPGPGHIFLVTGANMAGKSTLLRMAGVNLVLAMAGAPVCAKRMAFVPAALSTSVRTNDSLGDDESYFFAELKKLNRIITHLQSGKQLFVIIDEMLKGTNSRDKHTGSAALIRRLIVLDAAGLVATHDVELGSLAEEIPGRLLTRCFEVAANGDQFLYDYKLREGVSRSLNATFLMRKMGIIEGERIKNKEERVAKEEVKNKD